MVGKNLGLVFVIGYMLPVKNQVMGDSLGMIPSYLLEVRPHCLLVCGLTKAPPTFPFCNLDGRAQGAFGSIDGFLVLSRSGTFPPASKMSQSVPQLIKLRGPPRVRFWANTLDRHLVGNGLLEGIVQH